MKGYLKYLPIIGFSWWCTEFVFLRRNWQKDRKVLESSLSTLGDFPFPFWVGSSLLLLFLLLLLLLSSSSSTFINIIFDVHFLVVCWIIVGCFFWLNITWYRIAPSGFRTTWVEPAPQTEQNLWLSLSAKQLQNPCPGQGYWQCFADFTNCG